MCGVERGGDNKNRFVRGPGISPDRAKMEIGEVGARSCLPTGARKLLLVELFPESIERAPGIEAGAGERLGPDDQGAAIKHRAGRADDADAAVVDHG